jgi:hypothetical protein
MFEQELEMEQKEGRGIGPILMIVLMVGLLGGGIGYLVLQTTRTLKPTEAAKVVEASLKAQPISSVSFHAGHITPHMNDSPDKPQYALLADAGVITYKKDKKTFEADVALSPQGEQTITSIPEFQKKTESNGTVAYKVPLAARKFVKIENITKLAPNRFQVEYSWQWEPNKLGEVFNASGQYVKKFSTWDRAQLIDKYGADFYHSEPTRTTVLIIRGADGWTLGKE